MRKPRIKDPGCSHVVSRIVDKAFKLDDAEKSCFRATMLKAAAFSGVHVLTYAVLDNHFHILVEVPEREDVDEQELLRRVSVLYGETYTAAMRTRWDEWRALQQPALIRQEQERLRRRMYDLSEFMKTLKQRYTVSYNSRYRRDGTLWESRFKSVFVQGAPQALAMVAAYIDLNAVRAGLVTDPAEYLWSGYGQAVAGNRSAREGLSRVYVRTQNLATTDWNAVSGNYRELLYLTGEMHLNIHNSTSEKSDTRQDIADAIAHGVQLAPQLALRCRIRYFTAGLVLGERAFLEAFFHGHRSHFGAKRKTAARKMRTLGSIGLFTARNLQVDPVCISRN